MQETHRSIAARVTEIRNYEGHLIGGVTSLPVPGVMAGPLQFALTYAAWAHDWAADNPEGAYIPVFLAFGDDYEDLVDQIAQRARNAQAD